MKILSYVCAGLMGAAITIGVSAAAAESSQSGNRSGPTAQVQAPRQLGQVGAQREPTLPDSTLSGAPGWSFPGGGTDRVTLPSCQDRNASNFGQIGSCVYPVPTCQDPRALNNGAVGSCVYPQCSGGQVWNGSVCACPSGTSWNGSTCQRLPSCPGGQVWNGTSCVCPSGQQWNGAMCVTPSCPAGYQWNGSYCEEEFGHCGMPPNWGPNADPNCRPVSGGWVCNRNGGSISYVCP